MIVEVIDVPLPQRSDSHPYREVPQPMITKLCVTLDAKDIIKAVRAYVLNNVGSTVKFKSEEIEKIAFVSGLADVSGTRYHISIPAELNFEVTISSDASSKEK